MRPKRVDIPVAVTRASAVPAVTYVPAKTCFSGATGCDSPVRGGLVDAEITGRDKVSVRGNAVTGREQQQVTGNDRLVLDLDRLAVSPHADAERQHPAQRRHRLLGPVLLDKREHGVDHDHGHNRRGELRRPGDKRKQRARPEQQREELDEVCEKPAELGGPFRLGDRVRPRRRQPTSSFRARKTRRLPLPEGARSRRRTRYSMRPRLSTVSLSPKNTRGICTSESPAKLAAKRSAFRPSVR